MDPIEDDEFDEEVEIYEEYHSYDPEINPYILESLKYEHLMEEYFEITNINYE